MATVRYLVDDVERAEAFYVEQLGFVVEQEMLPAFARIRRDDLTLWLAGPKSSAGSVVSVTAPVPSAPTTTMSPAAS